MDATLQRSDVDAIANWLIHQALSDAEIEPQVIACCERLVAAGIPVTRAFFAFSVLHPLHAAIGIVWSRGSAVTTEDYPHVPGGGGSEAYRRSPFARMQATRRDVVRVHLDDPAEAAEFPITAELSQKGMTDFVAFAVRFGRDDDIGMNGSWSTDRAGGFSQAEIEALLRIQRRLAVASKVAINRQLVRNLVDTYLGTDAGRRVLDGQIQRGDGQSIEAAIWYADLRASTSMADTLPRQAYIETLNAFFDATGGTVQEHGGQILNLMGDALLAIFPTDAANPPGSTCARALDAALVARDRVDALNRRRQASALDPIDYGTALHFGAVMYGNVGTLQRLSFSAFGAVMNEVARLEKLTKELGEAILASDTFAGLVDRSWRPVGSFALRGIGRPLAVLAPDTNPPGGGPA